VLHLTEIQYVLARLASKQSIKLLKVHFYRSKLEEPKLASTNSNWLILLYSIFLHLLPHNWNCTRLFRL